MVHVLQTLTDLDPNATILSIDGVGAFDLVSRNAMMEGLLRMEGGDRILPFVRLFYRVLPCSCGRMISGRPTG